jgi:ABC-type transport system involved in cytochrome bd biosynthesis fused ATPase/permease subunit
VARALLSGATLWLLDEPTAALDELTRDRLLDRLLPLARTAGAAVLLASHDPVVLARCDRVLALDAGSPSS